MIDLQQIYIFTVFICFVVSLQYRKYHSFSVRILSILLFIILFVETSGYTLRTILKLNNQFLFHFYGPVEYSFMAFLYASHYKNQAAKKSTLISIPVFIVFCIVNSTYLQKLTETPYNFIVRCCLILLLVLYYFYELIKSNEVLIFSKIPLFWINIGNFFFYAGNFFVMGLMEQLLKKDSSSVSSLFVINTVLNIFLYLMFMISFLCKRT